MQFEDLTITCGGSYCSSNSQASDLLRTVGLSHSGTTLGLDLRGGVSALSMSSPSCELTLELQQVARGVPRNCCPASGRPLALFHMYIQWPSLCRVRGTTDRRPDHQVVRVLIFQKLQVLLRGQKPKGCQYILHQTTAQSNTLHAASLISKKCDKLTLNNAAVWLVQTAV